MQTTSSTVKRGACLRSKTNKDDEPFVTHVFNGQVHYVLENGSKNTMAMEVALSNYNVVSQLNETQVQYILEVLANSEVR